ncbi:MAG: hypothetical protein GEU79_19355 [Acidimicrobiia bacterium]|nr:hypothetical protein [Acidimicrobiia bacterium]
MAEVGRNEKRGGADRIDLETEESDTADRTPLREFRFHQPQGEDLMFFYERELEPDKAAEAQATF